MKIGWGIAANWPKGIFMVWWNPMADVRGKDFKR
jgi:hypothetical protein